MSVEENGEITHPGPILRAARDELKLSVEQVAEALHLRPTVVLMIESESYDEFSSDVFLKGYFRSYCRLVNLHEERMIELLETQLAHIEKERQSEIQGKADEAARAKRAHLFKLGSIALLIVLLGAAFVYVTTQDKPQGSVSLGEANVSAPTENASVNTSDSGNSQFEDEMEESDISDAEELSPDAGLVESDLQETAQQESVEESAFSDEVGDLEEDKPSVADLVELGEIESSSADEGEVISPDSSASLFIEFIDECWFEAYDANDNRIGAGLKKAGDKFRYDGDFPVRVVLGNGNVANIQVNGADYDFASSIRRSGRAEIVIEQETE